MRVTLCLACPYRPQDLGSYHDSEAETHLCLKCDGGLVPSTKYYPREKRKRDEVRKEVPWLSSMSATVS
jgi:hypothetical protein